MMKKAILIFLLLLNSNCSHQSRELSDPISSVWGRCSESFRTEFVSFENDITNKYRNRKAEFGDEYIAFLENKYFLNHRMPYLYEMCILICIYCETERNERVCRLIDEALLQAADGEYYWTPFLLYCWLVNNRKLDDFNLLDSECLRNERKSWESDREILQGTEEMFSEILRMYKAGYRI